MKYLIDLDGTLLDSRARMFSLFEALAGAGRMTLADYWDRKRMPMSHAVLLRDVFAYDAAATADFERRWLEEIESEESLARDTLFDHAAAALAALVQCGELYVLTARQNEAAARDQLERLGIAGLFSDVLVTGRGRSKAQAVLDHGLYLHADDALIGDTAEDIAAARTLRVRAIAVTGGFRTADYLRNAAPDAIFDDIAGFAAVEAVNITPVPAVSVVVVAYRQADVIGECLDSILAQDFHDYEIVIADDGSTDGTQEIARDYAERYPGRFVLALADRNAGVTVNANAGLALARGRYVAFVGGDDLMLPGKISRQVAIMERDADCTLCYHDLDVFSDVTGASLGRFSKRNRPRSGGPGQLVRYGAVNGACATMVRRSAMPERGFDVRVAIASDWLFWVETAMAGRVVYIDDVLGRYRRSDRSVTASPANQRRLYEDHLISCMILLAQYPAYVSELAQIMAQHCVSLGRRSKGLNRVGFFCFASVLGIAGILMLPVALLRTRMTKSHREDLSLDR